MDDEVEDRTSKARNRSQTSRVHFFAAFAKESEQIDRDEGRASLKAVDKYDISRPMAKVTYNVEHRRKRSHGEVCMVHHMRLRQSASNI